MYHHYMTSSSKFKILFSLYQHDELKDYLLPFKLMSEVSQNTFQDGQEFILRSALISENSKNLNSGVGLSINTICNYDEFQMAKKSVLQQETLDFAIVQPYWKYSKHVTILMDDKVFYGDVMGESNEFVMHSEVSSSGDQNLIERIKILTTKLKKYYSKNILIELGFREGEIKLFQVMQVEDPSLIHFFYQELFVKAQKAQRQLQESSIWQKLIREYRAKQFRAADKQANISNIFQNWLYIFHYYRLFCIKNKLTVSSISFESFLQRLNEQNQLSKMAKLHIEIANSFREQESLPELSGSFFDSREIYLGKNTSSYIFGKSAVYLEDLSIEQLERNRNNLILSTYSGILGHPCLYMAQEGIEFVGGLSKNQLNSFKLGDEITVDFNLRKIQVKSN